MNVLNKQVNLLYFKHIGLRNKSICLYLHAQMDVPRVFQNITNDHITSYCCPWDDPLLAHMLIYDPTTHTKH